MSFGHTFKGFELLKSLGYENEALIALTHSFLNGNLSANCEKDFIIYCEGWKKFLEEYDFNEYDLILNMVDLLVTENGVENAVDRVQGILNRRKQLECRPEFYDEFVKVGESLGLLEKDSFKDILDKHKKFELASDKIHQLLCSLCPNLIAHNHGTNSGHPTSKKVEEEEEELEL